MVSDADIRRLAAQGLDRGAIAARLLVKVQVVDGALARLSAGGESVSRGPGEPSRPDSTKTPNNLRKRGQLAGDWTGPEIEIVRDGYQRLQKRKEIRARLLAAGFDRTISAIGYIAQEHDLNQAPRPWSEDEVATLRELYVPGADPRAVAAAIGRPVKGVFTKANELGLHLRRPWTEEERETLVTAHAEGRPLVDVARTLQRPYANVAKIAEKMGLSFARQTASAKASPPPRCSPRPGAVIAPMLLLVGLAGLAQRLEAAVEALEAAARKAPAPASKQQPKAPVVDHAKARVADHDRGRAVPTARRRGRPPTAAASSAGTAGNADTPRPPAEQVMKPQQPVPAPAAAGKPMGAQPRPASAGPVPDGVAGVLPSTHRLAEPTTPLNPLRRPRKPFVPKRFGDKEAERALIERKLAEYRGAINTTVDLGADQPAVDVLRRFFNTVVKLDPKKCSADKFWQVNGSCCNTEDLWRRANRELRERGLPTIDRERTAA
jgi:hypothetical protein